MQLQDAISQISEIRSQIARQETFRGYRAVTVGLSGAMAVTAGVIQAVWLPDPMLYPWSYLSLWVGTAILSMIIVGMEMAWRCYRAESPWTTRMTFLALEQFFPCVMAGLLVTFILSMYAREQLWMLPGLWAILFSLGVFASCRLLPKPCFWVGVFYLLSGACCLVFGRGEHALSAWSMPLVFGTGQFLTSAILYYTLERQHA